MIRMVTEFLKNYGQKFHFGAFCIPNMTSSSQNILKRIRVGKAFLALSQIVNDFTTFFLSLTIQELHIIFFIRNLFIRNLTLQVKNTTEI